MPALFRTRGRRPLRWRVMSPCLTSGTGTVCERFLPTTSNSISRCTRFASGRADVGLFFTLYAKIDGVWHAPAWLEGREVIAVFEDRADPKPSYIMWLEWRDGRISFIRDYRYVRYVTADAELDAGAAVQVCGWRRRMVMPGAVLLDRRARQRTSSSMAGPRASGRHPPTSSSTRPGNARDGKRGFPQGDWVEQGCRVEPSIPFPPPGGSFDQA
jgi:hypothetical protein